MQQCSTALLKIVQILQWKGLTCNFAFHCQYVKVQTIKLQELTYILGGGCYVNLTPSSFNLSTSICI